MANQTRLISGGVNYYLTGSFEYIGSGSPWTNVGASPYEIGMNSTVGQPWTPQAAPRQEVYGGGPPFRNGQTLIYNSYGNVIETLTIQCRATSHDNAVFLLRQLRQILNTALYSTPCILAEQPNGATNPVYFDIYGADVQEDERFTNEEAGVVAGGHAVVRALVTWRRSSHGGLLSTAETLINAVTYNNTGTGGTDNVEAYATGAGDMIYEGSPLNIKVLPTTASSDPTVIYLASVANRDYSTAMGGSSSTASTTFVTVSSGSVTTTPVFTARGLKLRVIGRFSAMSTNAEVRLLYQFGTGLAQYTRPVIPNSAVAQLVDFGQILLPNRLLASISTAESIVIRLEARSTTGGAIAITLASTDALFYYDYCVCRSIGDTIAPASTEYLYIDSAVIKTGYPVLPRQSVRAWKYASNSLQDGLELRGTAPRYFSGASLWVGWGSPTVAHATTQAATVSAFHAPLWKTLRGSG